MLFRSAAAVVRIEQHVGVGQRMLSAMHKREGRGLEVQRPQHGIVRNQPQRQHDAAGRKATRASRQPCREGQLEAKVALEEFIARFAGYEIDGERSRRVHSTNVRGFATLPTTLAVR